MITSRFFAAALAAGLLQSCATPPQSAAPQVAADAAALIKADMAYLADDAREGREAGTKGYDDAAAYVANRFKEIGLKPGADGSYMQSLTLRTAAADQAAAKFSVLSPDGPFALKAGDDYLMQASFQTAAFKVDAPLVFVGHGIYAPDLGVDDYAGLDVKGKIVVALAGGGTSLPAEERAILSGAQSKTAIAVERGAAGMITVFTSSASQRFGWDRVKSFGGRPRMTWVGPDGIADDATGRLGAVAVLGPSGAAKLFEREAMSFADIDKADSEGKAIKGFALSKSASLEGAGKIADVKSANVIAMIEGSDPKLKKEVVVLTAHLDHEGVKPPKEAGGDAIYNGALDNSIGVSTMLDVARRFKASGKAPRRTIVITALTAEEKGLLGAGYMAAHPGLGDRKIVANVNLDMPLVLFPFVDVIAFGGERSSLGKVIESAAASMDMKVIPDPIPEQNIFVRSDHYRFVQKGVPAVFLFTGFGNGGDKVFQKFMAENYHQPSDELDLPIDYASAARFADLNYRIARQISDADAAPTWNEGDFFGRFFGKKR